MQINIAVLVSSINKNQFQFGCWRNVMYIQVVTEWSCFAECCSNLPRLSRASSPDTPGTWVSSSSDVWRSNHLQQQTPRVRSRPLLGHSLDTVQTDWSHRIGRRRSTCHIRIQPELDRCTHILRILTSHPVPYPRSGFLQPLILHVGCEHGSKDGWHCRRIARWTENCWSPTRRTTSLRSSTNRLPKFSDDFMFSWPARSSTSMSMLKLNGHLFVIRHAVDGWTPNYQVLIRASKGYLSSELWRAYWSNLFNSYRFSSSLLSMDNRVRALTNEAFSSDISLNRQ